MLLKLNVESRLKFKTGKQNEATTPTPPPYSYVEFFFQIISFCKDFFFQWELFKIHLHYFTTDKRAVIFNNENEVDTRTYPHVIGAT